MWPQIQLTIELKSFTILSIKTLLRFLFLWRILSYFFFIKYFFFINLVQRESCFKYITVTCTYQYFRKMLFIFFFLSFISFLIFLSANKNVYRLCRNIFLIWFIFGFNQFVIIKKAKSIKLNLINFIKFSIPNIYHFIFAGSDNKDFFLKSLKNFDTVNHFIIMSILIGNYIFSVCNEGNITKIISSYNIALYLAL